MCISCQSEFPRDQASFPARVHLRPLLLLGGCKCIKGKKGSGFILPRSASTHSKGNCPLHLQHGGRKGTVGGGGLMLGWRRKGPLGARSQLGWSRWGWHEIYPSPSHVYLVCLMPPSLSCPGTSQLAHLFGETWLEKECRNSCQRALAHHRGTSWLKRQRGGQGHLGLKAGHSSAPLQG